MSRVLGDVYKRQVLIVKAGADITEEVLQKAKLANKFIELSMNIQ